MFFARITRDEAKEMVAWRCLAPALFRRLIFAFFLFFLLLLLSFALSAGTERGPGRELSREVFNAFDERRLRRDDRLQRRQRRRLVV